MILFFQFFNHFLCRFAFCIKIFTVGTNYPLTTQQGDRLAFSLKNRFFFYFYGLNYCNEVKFI